MTSKSRAAAAMKIFQRDGADAVAGAAAATGSVADARAAAIWSRSTAIVPVPCAASPSEKTILGPVGAN